MVCGPAQQGFSWLFAERSIRKKIIHLFHPNGFSVLLLWKIFICGSPNNPKWLFRYLILCSNFLNWPVNRLTLGIGRSLLARRIYSERAPSSSDSSDPIRNSQISDKCRSSWMMFVLVFRFCFGRFYDAVASKWLEHLICLLVVQRWIVGAPLTDSAYTDYEHCLWSRSSNNLNLQAHVKG